MRKRTAGRRREAHTFKVQMKTLACVSTHASEANVPGNRRDPVDYCRLPATATVWPVM